MTDEQIFDHSTGAFTPESAATIIKSLANFIESDEISEISLIDASPFNIENFLKVKESILQGTFKQKVFEYSYDSDILLFYQISTKEKIYAAAHRDPFELYYNEVVMWFHEIPEKIPNLSNAKVIFKK